ncbi:hypothetical protein [Actinoplanes sp. NPDC020271]|uniref:hypothetical protein n=1 Tax=Actinoplanes sp. NPDC020271 TaxID=3363896 RepID=UPI0037A5CD96
MNNDNMTIDDEGAVRLLAPLRGEPDVRTAVDVPRAMAEGLRRRQLRRWSSAMAALTLTGVTIGGGSLAVSALRDSPAPVPKPTTTNTPAVVPTAAAPTGITSCTVARLPTGGVEKAVATAGDPSGRWAAGRLYSVQGHPSETIVWKDGAIHQRLPLPGADADIVDLNPAGVGVANGNDADDHELAFLYQDGKFTRLRGDAVSARAINENGVIAGSAGTAEQDPYPIRWASGAAVPARLPLPPGATSGTTADIAEDGTVLGSVATGKKSGTAYLWFPDGTGRYLPLPVMRDGKKATSFSGSAISNGWVSGEAVYETPDVTMFTPMRYRISTGEFETLTTDIGSAPVISADGWVAGEGRVSPVMVGAGRTVELPAYGAKSAGPGDVSYDIRAISADGHVVVGYRVGSGVTDDPLRWSCR